MCVDFLPEIRHTAVTDLVCREFFIEDFEE